MEILQKLEPWTVNQVKVTGGLDLLSSLAKGLPVSEDHEFIVNSEHLGAPPISKRRLLMLVGVFSTGNNFKRRMALRRTWMQYEAVRTGDIAVRFFIGFVSENCDLQILIIYWFNLTLQFSNSPMNLLLCLYSCIEAVVLFSLSFSCL